MEKQFTGTRINGFLMLFIIFILLVGCVWMFIYGAQAKTPAILFSGVALFFLLIFLPTGLTKIDPNDMRVMVFFGKYKGTFTENGFFWFNPLLERIKLTSRARNLDVEPIKVNDKAGNPVMIGLVLVWKVKDSYKALFDIDSSDCATVSKNGMPATIAMSARMASFQRFVAIQSDSALRNIAGKYAYDNNENADEITLRSSGDDIAEKLEAELNNRLSIAGIEVVEARINYLAYAPEIAAVMLRRQQAAAIVSAREKIVEGAVGMVRLALEKLEIEKIVELDEDKKAAMVSNLLVVLCSDEQAQPIVNTGTLHQ